MISSHCNLIQNKITAINQLKYKKRLIKDNLNQIKFVRRKFKLDRVNKSKNKNNNLKSKIKKLNMRKRSLI